MKVNEIMTPAPCCASPATSIAEVAELMRDNDCGSVPIVDDGCLVGIVTDRDLAIRALADGKSGETRVNEVMTSVPCCSSPDDEVDTVEKLMATNQVRRVPIVDADGRCVGIVAQADLARAAAKGERISDREVAIVVEAISVSDRDGLRGGPDGEIAQRL
jgi:CBS domain-containing protein